MKRLRNLYNTVKEKAQKALRTIGKSGLTTLVAGAIGASILFGNAKPVKGEVIHSYGEILEKAKEAGLNEAGPQVWGEFSLYGNSPAEYDVFIGFYTVLKEIEGGYVSNLVGYADAQGVDKDILSGQYYWDSNGGWGFNDVDGKPLGAFVIIDKDGNGIGDYNSATGEFIMDENDQVILSEINPENFTINGITPGDFSSLSAYNGDDGYLGNWNITPEPGTIGLLALGGGMMFGSSLFRKRKGGRLEVIADSNN